MFVRHLAACSVCDEPQTTDTPAGRFEWTDLDLDLKAVDERGWMWPENSVRCIACGACGVTIWNFPPGTGGFVRSEEYHRVSDAAWPSGFRDEMAAGLLGAHLGWSGYAFERYLVAVWIADDAQRWLGADDPDWSGLSDLARRRAVDAWMAAAGDPTTTEVARDTEHAAVTLVGHVLLDNQVLVDLLRRSSDWPRAAAAAQSARRGIRDTLAAWGGMAGLCNDDERQIVQACQIALDIEERLIAQHDASRANTRLELPIWFAG